MNGSRLSKVYGPEQMEQIRGLSELVCEPMTPEDLLASPERLNEVEVIFGGWGLPRFDEELLAHAPKLKAVFYAAGTVKPFVTDAFWERGLLLTNAQHANAIPVAEYCVSTILFSLKRGWRNMRRIHDEKTWERDENINGIYGARVGLISMGTIGRLTLGLLKPFHLKVMVCCTCLTQAEADALGVELVGLETIFEKCDVVSLHTPVLPETIGMIRGEHFRIMKPDATFINTSRGAVVNQPEMVAALKDREDITAVLDVLEPEPPEVDCEILGLANAFITPHIAGSQGNECRRLGQSAIDEYKRFAAGAALEHRIVSADLQKMA